MRKFVYRSHPARVLFGSRTIDQVSKELENLSIKRPMILTTAGQKEDGQRLAATIKSAFPEVSVFAGAVMHTPSHVTTQALELYQRAGADGTVALGGGSTIGLGKALALKTDHPQIAIPTTYAGSEMTPIVGQTEKGIKTTQNTPAVLPETVIYDVDLTQTLPLGLSVTSGMNAIAHAVEALYVEDTNPVLQLMAEEAIRSMLAGLSGLLGAKDEDDARSECLYGAWLCAVCLGTAGVALHHKLCHVLGGSFDLPHAETHTVVLPHALAYNAPKVPHAMAILRRATGSERPEHVFFDLAAQAGVATSLKDLGMAEDGIDKAVEIAFQKPYPNPRALERASIRTLITEAFEGRRPQ